MLCDYINVLIRNLIMERLNPHTCSMFWKMSGIMLLFISATSFISNKCHENNTMSRKHIIKFSELLRSAMEHSIKATQDSDIITKYKDACTAKISIDIVVNMLTPSQLRVIASNIDVLETQEYISKQHQEILVEINNKNAR